MRHSLTTPASFLSLLCVGAWSFIIPQPRIGLHLAVIIAHEHVLTSVNPQRRLLLVDNLPRKPGVRGRIIHTNTTFVQRSLSVNHARRIANQKVRSTTYFTPVVKTKRCPLHFIDVIRVGAQVGHGVIASPSTDTTLRYLDANSTRR